MRKSSVVLTISALFCVGIALNLSSTEDGAFARCLVFGASQESQEDGDSNGVSFEIDFDFDDASVETRKTEKADDDSSDKLLSDLPGGVVVDSASDFDGVLAEKQETENADKNITDGFSTDADDRENVENDVSDDLPSLDDFMIDENDILGSAFNGLALDEVPVDAKTFDFERDSAVEFVGGFSAGAWIKTRVEQEKNARETERAKYADAADVPDEYKTLDDFFATITKSEREFVDQEKKPDDAIGWFQFARKISQVGRLEFAKRALEESLLAETGDGDSNFLSNAELENDARRSGLDEVYVRLERGAFERLCLASFTRWSDASRFDAAFERAFKGSESERAAALDALARGGDYGAARFCRLSLNKFFGFKRDARGNVVFGKNSSGSSKEYDAYLRPAASYFERVGFGAALVALRESDESAVEALVDVMEFTREPEVWADLCLLYYDESRSQALRNSIGNVLQRRFGKVPARSQAVVTAYKQALGYYERALKLPGASFPKTDLKKRTSYNADAKTFIWRWNAETKTPTPVLVDVERAYLYEATRLARASDRLATKYRVANKEARALAIASTSELLLAQVGADAARSVLKKFKLACPNLTIDELSNAAQFAIKAKRFRGALIPIILLGDEGDSSLFNSTRNNSSVAVQGSSCADRRVRYETLRAVFKWNPQRDFTGSRNVLNALEWFASARGARVVVVLAPDAGSQGFERVVAGLTKFGFVVKTGKTVHEILSEVQDEADLEFVYLPDGLDSTTIQSAAKALRMEPTTAETPLLAGALDDKADVFDLEADKLAGLRFYDSVVPSNVPRELRARQAKCAARALEKVKKLQSDVIAVSEKVAKKSPDKQDSTVPNSVSSESKSNERNGKGSIRFK